MASEHRGNPFMSAACAEEAAKIEHLFHPDSDVGPMDDACMQCGHLHADAPSSPDEDCPLLDSLEERHQAQGNGR